jgi:hypothetical protein
MRNVKPLADGLPALQAPSVIPQSPVDENGFRCPECRFKMRVYLTKQLTGSVYRVRICDRCGHREPTEERAI